MNISLCMIVKNEESVLGRCLDTVGDFFNEIIIVDTGSTDKTIEIAKKYTDKIYNFKWIDDFSAARNFSFEKSSCEYIMWLDADDIILPRDMKKLSELDHESADIIMLKYNLGFDEQDNTAMSFFRERIIRNNAGFRWSGRIHEAINIEKKVIYKDIAITHKKLHCADPQRNLRIFKKMLSDGDKFTPREQFYYARELYYAGEYKNAIEAFEEFLKNPSGWVENRINACIDLAACYTFCGNHAQSFDALFKSFLYDRPRAEICCEIGKRFMERFDFQTAVFWYETALNIPMILERNGFCTPDCYTFIPYMQLCVCYDRLQNHKKAKEYNDKAAAVKPKDKSVLYNKEYFDKLYL